MRLSPNKYLKKSSPFSLKNIKAVIFDMDDLMINSHPVHMMVVEKVLQHYGVVISDSPLTPQEEASQFGRKITDMLEFLHKKYNLPQEITIEKMNAEFNELLLPTFEENVQKMPGLTELINILTGKYILVLASSAKRKKIDIVLKELKLANIFNAIVSGEDEIKHGKPQPDIFLKAAEKVGITEMNSCLVLEDAKNGVEEAKAADMKVIGVYNKFAQERLGLRQDLHISDLEVDNLNAVRSLFET
jgi:HAD superfamily hydrolase (TIGR01509 family)